MINGTVLARFCSYALILATGALVGFGAMTLMSGRSETPREPQPAEHEVTALTHSILPLEHAEAEMKDKPQAEPAAEKPAAHSAEPGTHPSAEAEKHDGANAEELRKKFELFYDKFLSADCSASKKSEEGVQFGPNYFTVFIDDRRVRYVEGYYQFDRHGMKFIFGDQYILFTIDSDSIFMSEILIEQVIVSIKSPDKWKICPSPPRTRPEWQLPILSYTVNDGLLFALKAEDMEAITYYLTKGGYVPARKLKTVLETVKLNDRAMVMITEVSARNEEADIARKAAEAARPKPPPPSSKPAAAPAKKSGH
ncbi:MAG: hypothetical protein WCF85_11820 [Rhodospirillaceae bacterium]